MLQVGQRSAEQEHLRGRVGKVNILRDQYRIGPAANQVARQFKGLGIGSFVAEGPGVGKHGGIEASGHLGCDVDAGRAGQLVDQLRNRAGAAVDPVHVGECTAAGVVVDIDQETVLQSFQPGARNPVTFQQNDCVVVALHAAPVPNQRRRRAATGRCREPGR